MSHYFSEKQGKFKGEPFNFSFMNENYIWQGSTGVFSGHALDNGALALLSTVVKDFSENQKLSSNQHTSEPVETTLPFLKEAAGKLRILDLGCGTGIVGLMIARQFPQLDVVLSDVNAWAVQCSAVNGKKHKIENASYVIEDELSSLGNRAFDLIAFNPPIRAGNELILSMFEDSARVLTSDGSLYIVARVKQGAKRMADLASKWYDTCEFKLRMKGYLVFRLSKPKV